MAAIVSLMDHYAHFYVSELVLMPKIKLLKRAKTIQDDSNM